MFHYKKETGTCPFAEICPKLKELKGAIYGYCLYQPLYQQACTHYQEFYFNPSFRKKRNINGKT